MIYSNQQLTQDANDHHWAVVKQTCDLAKDDDPLLGHAVEVIRQAYGEDEIKRIVEHASIVPPAPAEGLVASFDTDTIMAAFRKSIPDPDREGNKPAQLTNYRSETAELIARAALAKVYGFETPPALHAAKPRSC